MPSISKSKPLKFATFDVIKKRKRIKVFRVEKHWVFKYSSRTGDIQGISELF